MKYQSSHTLAAFLLSAASLIAVVSCQDTDYPAPQPATGPSTVVSRVQFVNASPDAASLNFLIENVSSGSAVAPGGSTGYLNAPGGSAAAASAQLRVDNIGGTLGTTDVVIKPLLNANPATTVFVTDTINRPAVRNAAGTVTDAGGVRVVQVADPLTQTLVAGSGGVRFFHFVPDLGLPANSTATSPLAASVRISPATSSTGTTITVTNRAYRAVTPNTFAPIPAGTYRVEVFSGASITGTATPVASSTITVDATKLYTLYAQGLVRRRTVSVGRIQHN